MLEWFEPEAHAPLAQNRRSSKFFFIYVLWSEKLRKRYVGSSVDVGKRLNEHNNGLSKFTKGGIPWKLIHSEELGNKAEAQKREKYLKTGAGRDWLDKENPQYKH